MPAKQTPAASSEGCEACGIETQHRVEIQIRTESTTGENAAFSREPYRVTTCLQCGQETAIRMNNA